jgi:hypothetical protein
VKAVNQQQQQQQQQPPIRGINSTIAAAINSTAPPPPIILINGTTPINGTAGQNYTFAATSPVVSSDKLLYLGYHGNSDSKHDDSRDSKTQPFWF